jgi:hypothetical protein
MRSEPSQNIKYKSYNVEGKMYEDFRYIKTLKTTLSWNNVVLATRYKFLCGGILHLPHYTYFYHVNGTISVASLSKAWVCGNLLAVIVASNPTGGKDNSFVSFVCCQAELRASR